jgi:hypothetical protein
VRIQVCVHALLALTVQELTHRVEAVRARRTLIANAMCRLTDERTRERAAKADENRKQVLDAVVLRARDEDKKVCLLTWRKHVRVGCRGGIYKSIV